MHIALEKGDEIWASLAYDEMVDIEQFCNPR
jgi:hypothetical protein